MDTVNLTPDDLSCNHQGVMSSQQIHLLRQQRPFYVMGTAVFFLLLLLLLLTLLLKFQVPTFANKGQLFLLIPLGLFWLWLLRESPRKWQQINQDLQEQNIVSVEGRVQYAFGSSLGLVQLMKYGISVGKQRFRVNKEVCFQFNSGQPYRVYYSPHAQLFLGAVALSHALIEKPEEQKEKRPFSTPIFVDITGESLHQRDIELLHLIAAGLSNKEIAAQLSLSVNTVKMYSSQLYRKLGVSRRTEALNRAKKLGIL